MKNHLTSPALSSPAFWRETLGAGMVYALLGIILTWPTLLRPSHYVISEHLDTITAFYNLWWFHEAICALHTSPWTNPLLDFPEGYSMIFFPVWIPYDALALPFIHFWDTAGLPYAFNLINWLSLVASGVSMFLLVRYLTRDFSAALVSGLALAAAPFRFWNLSRWHVSCLELVVLPLYFFLRLLRGESGRNELGFALSVSLLAYTSPNYSGDMILALALVLLYSLWRKETIAIRSLLKKLGKAALVMGIICAPLLARLALEFLRQPLPLQQPDSLRLPYSANLLGFITPGFNLRAYTWLMPFLSYADQDLTREHGIAGYEIFLGYTALGLALCGLFMKIKGEERDARGLFLLLTLVFLLLSLGPVLHVGTKSFDGLGFYDLASALLPWLKIERTPVRHSAFTLISVVALAGFGLAALGWRLSRPRRILLNLVAGVAIVLEFNPAPLSLTQLPRPPFVEEIKKDAVPGSLLYLPYLPDIKRLCGLTHMELHRPLAFQLTSRLDDPRYQQGALFRNLDRPRIWLLLTGEERDHRLRELRKELARRQVRYLIVYPRFMTPEDLAGLRSLLADLKPEAILRDDDLYLVCRFSPW